MDKKEIHHVISQQLSTATLATIRQEHIRAVSFAEVNARGEPRSVTIISQDESGLITVLSGFYGINHGDEHLEGDVEFAELVQAIPILQESRVGEQEQELSKIWVSEDLQWIHLYVGYGNHLFICGESLIMNALKHFSSEAKTEIFSGGIDDITNLLQKNEE